MNKQEMFDKVATHLLKQNRKSLLVNRGELMSAYFGEDGCKCAAGCLIPPERYSLDWEGMRVMGIEFFQKLCDDLEVASFLSYLQKVHDNNRVADWREELILLAQKFNLDPKVCLPA